MNLLASFLSLPDQWDPVFCQHRTWERAQRQALGSLVCLGRSTVSRILWTAGREQESWSGEYFLFSRAPWEPQQLFAPLLKQALRPLPQPSGGRGCRRHTPSQDGSLHRPSSIPPRPPIAALSYQLDVEPALPAGLPVAAPASFRPFLLPRPAHSIRRGLHRQKARSSRR